MTTCRVRPHEVELLTPEERDQLLGFAIQYLEQAEGVGVFRTTGQGPCPCGDPRCRHEPLPGGWDFMDLQVVDAGPMDPSRSWADPEPAGHA